MLNRLLKACFAGIVASLEFAAPARAADDAKKLPPLGWAFEVALGGSLATGNTDRQALDLNSKAQFRTERREDRYRLLGDFGRENGAVTAERIEAGLQSNYNLSQDKFYLIGFTQYRRDRFSGYLYEAEVGPGLGYRFVYTDRMTFALEFSTGYRHGELRGLGNDDDLIFARGTATVDYQLSDQAKLTNEALVTGDNQRVRIEDTLSITSRLIRDIALRASVNARYVSSPPVGIKKLDTLSKVALVYAF